MAKFKTLLKSFSNKVNAWVRSHQIQLAVFNVLIVMLVLIRSAGYFHPFFVLSVNFIVLTGLIAAIFLLGASARALFLVTLAFWIFAAFLKVIKIDVWAERTSIYTYQALVLGVVLSIIESIKSKN